jgi:hypothetical protein
MNPDTTQLEFGDFKVVPHNLDETGSEHPAVILGREAWERLKKDQTWEDWTLAGKALIIGRSECLNAANTNSVDDKRYRGEFGRWLKANGFGDIDKAARSWLFKCMENCAEIEAWRASLPLCERLKVNHPQSVFRKWKAATLKEKTARLPAKAGLRDENMRLQEDLDAERAKNRRLERLQEGLTEGRDWTWQDSAKDIAAAWVRLHRAKAMEAAREVIKLANPPAEKPATRVKSVMSTAVADTPTERAEE